MAFCQLKKIILLFCTVADSFKRNFQLILLNTKTRADIIYISFSPTHMHAELTFTQRLSGVKQLYMSNAENFTYWHLITEILLTSVMSLQQYCWHLVETLFTSHCSRYAAVCLPIEISPQLLQILLFVCKYVSWNVFTVIIFHFRGLGSTSCRKTEQRQQSSCGF